MNDQKLPSNSASEYQYQVIQCYSCGNLLLAKKIQKTKFCTYCGKMLRIRDAKILIKARTAIEASMIIRRMKEE